MTDTAFNSGRRAGRPPTGIGPVARLVVDIPADLKSDLDHLAVANERSMSVEVRRALRAHIERHEATSVE